MSILVNLPTALLIGVGCIIVKTRAGYDNVLTMTAVFEDGAEGASSRALCELQYGRTLSATPLYSR